MKLFPSIQILSILLHKSTQLTSDEDSISDEKSDRPNSLEYDFDNSDFSTKAGQMYLHHRKHHSKRTHSKEDGSKEDGSKQDGSKQDGSKQDGSKEDGSSENCEDCGDMMPAAQEPMQNMMVFPLPGPVPIVNAETISQNNKSDSLVSNIPWPGWPSGWSAGGFPGAGFPGVPGLPGVPALAGGVPGISRIPGLPGIQSNQWPGLSGGWPPNEWQQNGWPGNSWPPAGWPGLPSDIRPEDFLPDGVKLEDLVKNLEEMWPGLKTKPTGHRLQMTSPPRGAPAVKARRRRQQQTAAVRRLQTQTGSCAKNMPHEKMRLKAGCSLPCMHQPKGEPSGQQQMKLKPSQQPPFLTILKAQMTQAPDIPRKIQNRQAPKLMKNQKLLL